MKKFLPMAATVLSLLLPPLVPIHAERSPVFGTASIESLSSEAARDIMARGELANYYGNLAISYSYTAYIYAFYARYYAGSNTWNEKHWYEIATHFAYHAYIMSWHAAYYSSLGM